MPQSSRSSESPKSDDVIHVDGPLASAGVKTHYSAPSTADSFSQTFALGTSITLGASAGRDSAASESPSYGATSAPTDFTSCLSVTDGSCSPSLNA